MPWSIDKGYCSHWFSFTITPCTYWCCCKSFRSSAFSASVKDCICISKPNGYTSFHLLTMSVSPDAGEGIYQCGLAMVNMTDHTNICIWNQFFWHQLFNLLTYFHRIILIAITADSRNRCVPHHVHIHLKPVYIHLYYPAPAQAPSRFGGSSIASFST